MAPAATPNISHRDGLGRLQVLPAGAQTDYYLRPKDGRLVPLRVQHSNRLSSQSPAIIKVISWMYSRTPNSSSKSDGGGNRADLAKWLPGSLVILLLLFIPTKLNGEVRNGGKYDPVRYREWLYDRIARNRFENKASDDDLVDDRHEETLPLIPDDEEALPLSIYPVPTASGTHWQSEANLEVDASARKDLEARLLTRELGPKLLCFLVPDDYGRPTYRTMRVEDYMRDKNSEARPDYVFLSYTRKQFCVATPDELETWDVSAEERDRLKSLAPVDRAKLGQYGIRAAQRARLSAFWLDFECLQPDLAAGETAQSMSDVYRICDIVRTSDSIVIVRGPPIDNRLEPADSTTKAAWLHQWGERLWTVPEGLLCPSDVIDIYTDCAGEDSPEPTPKRSLAARAWRDADNMRQLIDHYESSVHLTPLELVSVALEGLQWRKTDMNTPGDASYALMGLLRRRPAVDTTDSDFEAFARLSLANDSDMLLERLLCMQSSHPAAPWHEIKDAWGARLWDIEPHCQVAGIVDNRTVTLDGAFGATICWEKLEQVAFFKRQTVGRTVAQVLLRLIPGYLVMGLALVISGAVMQAQVAQMDQLGGQDYYTDDQSGFNGVTNGLLIAGAVITGLTVLLALGAPAWLFSLYRGKFWSTQAWFIGMSGIPDLGHVEECIFGMNDGRLQWSATGSLLSRHKLRDGERRGLPPEGKDQGSLKVYTIIDTFTLTATAFYAERPPSVVMICGREGGMQRAVLCSYDWKTQTFCKEVVLRMKTLVLERISRVDRFRFCLSRHGRKA